MPIPNYIELPGGECLAILHEDRSSLAIDKPAGWMLVPFDWRRTDRNLHAALVSSIAAGDYWARVRGLKFLRHVHRLDTETTGILLFAKSAGAVHAYTDLFEQRLTEKRYLAVVAGVPSAREWTCRAGLAPDPRQHGRILVDDRNGKTAETHFVVEQTSTDAQGRPCALIEAQPYSGRTHQIRVHLAHAGHPVLGDELYGGKVSNLPPMPELFPMALRSVVLSFRDVFTRRPVCIRAPADDFLRAFRFKSRPPAPAPRPPTRKS